MTQRLHGAILSTKTKKARKRQAAQAGRVKNNAKQGRKTAFGQFVWHVTVVAKLKSAPVWIWSNAKRPVKVPFAVVAEWLSRRARTTHTPDISVSAVEWPEFGTVAVVVSSDPLNKDGAIRRAEVAEVALHISGTWRKYWDNRGWAKPEFGGVKVYVVGKGFTAEQLDLFKSTGSDSAEIISVDVDSPASQGWRSRDDALDYLRTFYRDAGKPLANCVTAEDDWTMRDYIDRIQRDEQYRG